MWVFDLFFWVKEWWFLIALCGGGIISFKRGIESINANLKDVIYQLKAFNDRILSSERDREKIHQELEAHDARIDEHNNLLAVHDERIKMLFNERK